MTKAVVVEMLKVCFAVAARAAGIDQHIAPCSRATSAAAITWRRMDGAAGNLLDRLALHVCSAVR